MEKNEIKKLLYKESPIATFNMVRNQKAYYTSIVNDIHIIFEIPVSDMGDADLLPTMEGKLLIRWIQ